MDDDEFLIRDATVNKVKVSEHDDEDNNRKQEVDHEETRQQDGRDRTITSDEKENIITDNRNNSD